MEREKVINDITEILIDALMLEEGSINPEDNLESFGVDSMALVDLTLKIEEKYNIVVDDFVLVNIKTLNEAADAILAATQKS